MKEDAVGGGLRKALGLYAEGGPRPARGPRAEALSFPRGAGRVRPEADRGSALAGSFCKGDVRFFHEGRAEISLPAREVNPIDKRAVPARELPGRRPRYEMIRGS